MSQPSSLVRGKVIKRPVFTAFIISVCLHSLLLIPFWKYRTLRMTIPEKPMKLVLEMSESVPETALTQPPAPRPRPVSMKPSPKPKVQETQTKPVEKLPVKPIEKKPTPKFVEKEPDGSNLPAPVVAENAPVAHRETKPVVAAAESKPAAAIAETAKVQSPELKTARPAVAVPETVVKDEGAGDSKNVGKKQPVSTVYLQTVHQRIQKFKRYPRLARDRGIEGKTLLELVLAGDGKLLDTRVLHSSGAQILDREALLTLRRAAPFPKLPESQMVGKVFLEVTISFEIED